jgi:hypothetical protein
VSGCPEEAGIGAASASLAAPTSELIRLWCDQVSVSTLELCREGLMRLIAVGANQARLSRSDRQALIAKRRLFTASLAGYRPGMGRTGARSRTCRPCKTADFR